MDTSFPVDHFFIPLAQSLGELLQPISRGFQQFSIYLLGRCDSSFLHKLEEFLKTEGNVHSKDLPLMNPFDVILILLCYVSVVFFGRFLMAFKKEPFKFKYFTLFHNLFLMFLSAYMTAEILHQAYINKYTLWGNPVDSGPRGEGMAKVLWIFYFSKIIEFLDTVIMVLKKNNRQVSFLHVYHHLSIFGIWWLVLFTAPGGESYYSAALNSFVHVVMYGYYYFTAIGVSQVKFIKKYITQMQMLQFVTNMLQAGYDLFTGGGGYPLLPTRILFYYMITLLILFANFYIQDRLRERAERSKDKSKKTN